MLEQLRYVVVEGPIGAGKTTLARRLAAHLEFEPLLEAPEENPFLAKFYQNRSRYALATQLSFLLHRLRLMEQLNQRDLERQSTVADFLIDKDVLFARLTLSEQELELYHAVHQQLTSPSPAPDLVVYLTASAQTLLTRVRTRDRRDEKGVTLDYLATVADAYSRFFYNYRSAPVLTVSSDNLNFVADTGDFELLLQRIKEMRGSKEFFNRG